MTSSPCYVVIAANTVSGLHRFNMIDNCSSRKNKCSSEARPSMVSTRRRAMHLASLIGLSRCQLSGHTCRPVRHMARFEE